MQNYKEIYNRAKKTLENAQIECVNSELLNIFWYCFGLNRSDLVLCSSKTPDDLQYQKFCEIIQKRCSGIPLQYAVGKCSFMGIDLNVGEGVLIPREDTSVLVNASLNSIKDVKSPKIIDLCSGSGCIAFALERIIGEPSEIYAVEISPKAFKYLSANHKKCKSKVNLINDDIFSCYENFQNGYFDLIVSNPPYIKSGDIPALQSEVLREPHLALDGGKIGLDFYQKICEFWIPKLKKGGVLAFEVGQGQHNDVKKIMGNFCVADIEFFLDINSIYRAVVGKKIF